MISKLTVTSGISTHYIVVILKFFFSHFKFYYLHSLLRQLFEI